MQRLRTLATRWLPWLVTAGALLAMLPVLYIGVYNHPSPPGDFQNAEWASFIAIQKDLYLHWSGRYFSNITAILTPVHWHSFEAYRAVLVLHTGVFIAISIWFLYAALRHFTRMPARNALAIASLGTAVIINNFSSLSEGFFWYTSAVTYVIAVITMYGVLLLMIRADARPEKASTGLLVPAVLLAWATIGSDETMLAACDLLVFGAWIYYRKNGSVSQRKFYRVLLWSCIIFTAVALLAPGNYMRQEVHPRNVRMVPATWLYTCQKTFFQWISEPSLVLLSLAVLILGKGKSPLQGLGLLGAFLLPGAILLFMSLPAHYVLGTAPPPRVMNVIYCFFLPGWVVFMLHLRQFLSSFTIAGTERSEARTELMAAAAIIIVLAVTKLENLRGGKLLITAKSLAKGIPQAYNAELNQRYAYIRAQPGDTVMVKPLQHLEGNVLYFQDIIPLRTSGTSAQYARYFGKKMILLDTGSVR